MKNKIIHVFEKPRARTFYQIEEDNQDSWFLHVKKVEKKTGKINSSSMIIEKDLSAWITTFANEGWIESSN